MKQTTIYQTLKIMVGCLAVVSILASAGGVQAAPAGLRVGIYSGTGAESSTTLAMYRAVASMGHSPMALTTADILGGRLTRVNFDVFIIPPGEDGKKCCADHHAATDDSTRSPLKMPS